MIPDVINIKRNPTGYIAAASAVYAAALMISNAVHHHGVIDTPTIVAAVTAVSALLTRQIVTPVAQPRDGNGNLLVPLTVIPLAGVTGEPASAYNVIPVQGSSGAPEEGLP